MKNIVELKTITCRGKRPGPKLLITGGVHGDEFEPMVAIRRLAKRLHKEDLTGTVTMVPVVNEEAFLLCSRTASDGLDLARTCPGNVNGSITERVAHQLSNLIQEADYYIDLHTGGTTMSIYPLAGYMLDVDLKVRDAQHNMARAFNLPLVWGTDPNLDGRSLSVARDAGIPAIYVEYHGAAVCDPAGVDAMVEGCLNTMNHLQMLTRPEPVPSVLYDVQETRSDSGFFQRSHLSPCDGYFETDRLIGNFINRGELLGTVVDPLGETRVDIPAETTGLINCLRTFPSVRKNDSLGYIVETGKNSNE